MFQHRFKLTTAAFVLACLSAPAVAEDALAKAVEPTPDWTFPNNVSLVSDYIFRGQSQTWGKPSLQAMIEADHKSGFYIGLAAATVSDKWLPGANVEVDYFAGFRNTLPGAASVIGFDVGAIYYTYPGANWDESAFAGTNSNRLDTAEAYLGLSYKWLSFKMGSTLTEYFGWNPNNSGVGIGFNGDLSAGVTGDTKGSSFYEFNALYEFAPSWSVNGQVGHQHIRNATGLDLTYYKAGVTKSFTNGWLVGASYSATNEPDAYKDFLSLKNTVSKSDIAKDKLFFSVSKSF